MSEFKWNECKEWHNDTIRVGDNDSILFFDSNSSYESAICYAEIPDNAISFSLTFKAGNSCLFTKISEQDAGYISIGFVDINFVEYYTYSKSTMIQGNETYNIYSLGINEHIVLPAQKKGFIYIKAECYNDGKNGCDFYFGDFDLNFHNNYGTYTTGYDSFISSQRTSDKVLVLENKYMRDKLILNFVTIIIICLVFILSYVLSKKHTKHKKKSRDI